ncbi:MAG: phosphoglycerate kinase [Gemmatimonadetes bacterium]|nr:phosphoglycerate kinase [Gemmatimonadota bacterium]
MKKMTIRDASLQGKRVLVRVDFNVPLSDAGTVADDKRIRAAIPTIRHICDAGATCVLMTHLGRPGGRIVPELSLAPVAEHLRNLLGGQTVHFIDACAGERVEERIAGLGPGEVILLENLRFHEEETANDPAFAKQLARLGDIYVNDAFGTAHRAHASTAGVTRYYDLNLAGFLMEKEIDHLSSLLEAPKSPFVALLGGAKISGKIDVIRSLSERVDRLLLGGGMVGTFYAAQGKQIGDSLVEEDRFDVARAILSEVGPDKLLLPTDAVIASAFEVNAERRIVSIDEIEPGWRMLDIGPETVTRFASEIRSAQTVFWNGPMGVFEMEPFAKGTRALAEAAAEATDRGVVTVIGGGDTARAIGEQGLEDRITHVSTGGGASLEFVEGRELPGVVALTDRS